MNVDIFCQKKNFILKMCRLNLVLTGLVSYQKSLDIILTFSFRMVRVLSNALAERSLAARDKRSV